MHILPKYTEQKRLNLKSQQRMSQALFLIYWDPLFCDKDAVLDVWECLHIYSPQPAYSHQ